MYLRVLPLNENYPAPHVPIHCFYGVSVSTQESYAYGNGFSANPTNINHGDGDGSLNLLSSQVCLKWQNEQSEPFSTFTFPGVNHAQMVTNTEVLEAVADIVRAPMPSSPMPTSAAASTAASLVLMLGSTTVLLLLMFE